MFQPLKVALVICLLGTAACGPKVNVESPVVFDDERSSTLEEEEMSRIKEENPDREIEALDRKTFAIRPKNVVSRTELNEVLDRGVGSFLSHVEVAPHLDVGQRFIGWQIVRLKLSGVDLQPGDIVLAVNKSKIERPGQVQKIWEDLRQANAIYVSAERAGKPFEVRIDVIQDTTVETP